MDLAETAGEVVELTAAYSLTLLCCPCIALRYLLRSMKRHGRATYSHPLLPRYPDKLPLNRLDILSGTIVAPSPSCHLLQLPPELRHQIFELAVGNRLVRVQLVPNDGFDAYILQTTCFLHHGFKNSDTPLTLWALETAEPIPVALLLSCRSVYTEVLPILYGRNTVLCYMRDFPRIIECGLGMHVLPEIRHLYFQQPHFLSLSNSSPVWPMLESMQLNSLTVEFFTLLRVEFDNMKWTRYLQVFRLDDFSAHALLALPNLRNLNIIFRSDHLDPPVPAERAFDSQTFQEFITEPADDQQIA
ncbi:hypothetical protein R3P38DRAFT_2619976 [Favolaschia claudopus]|uniref:DUF7730 domain-containing protein n=1 Tax=Favolaschia claudopus TaxID=2862362 RepID=A0AAW0BZA6_9AGAR